MMDGSDGSDGSEDERSTVVHLDFLRSFSSESPESSGSAISFLDLAAMVLAFFRPSCGSRAKVALRDCSFGEFSRLSSSFFFSGFCALFCDLVLDMTASSCNNPDDARDNFFLLAFLAVNNHKKKCFLACPYVANSRNKKC